MANYMFRRDDNPAGFLATRRLGTDVLNALGALRASGHAIEFDPESIVEREDEHGEIVMLEVHGPREPGWHYNNEVGTAFSDRGVRIAVFGS